MTDRLQQLQAMITSGATTEQALDFFDALEAVELHMMIGQWRGVGLPTQHLMDGLLESFGWYGKAFFDPDHVHPLLFKINDQVAAIDPRWVPISLVAQYQLPLQNLLAKLSTPAKHMMTTSESRARIRMVDFRGKLSATMIYDHFPIFDIFRRIDDNTLLGVMDFKGIKQPFFFVLYRDN
ncbi:MAG: DUF4334 domain-containing protein [Pseudomonadota bacterium]|nr:DUF4334 domain-containing protein [Pseudomonadota bacterium]